MADLQPGFPAERDPVEFDLPSNGSATPTPLTSYNDFNGDWKAYLEYMANKGDEASLDKLLNYLMSEQSSLTARDWTAKREDTAWQRLVADMRAAGINPYAFATFGANPIASGSQGHNYSGAYASNYAYKKATLEQNQEKIDQNWLKLALSAFLPVIGAVIAGMI